jgi:Ni/Fe-hydrogenase subunit HybB-like protein
VLHLQPRDLARRGLLWALVASLLITLADALVGALAGTPRAVEAARLLAFSPLLWIYAVVGIVVPLYLLAAAPARPAALAWGASLAILGVLVEKTQLLAVGQAQPWLPGAVVSYLPSWIEIVGIVGLAAAGVVAYGLLMRFRRIEP